MEEQFVRHYEDLSSERGYQFKFYCDHCGQESVTLFEPCRVDMGVGLMSGANHLFGFFLGEANSQRCGNDSKEYRRALQKAANKGKDRFHKCIRCNKWVCSNCWDAASNRCKSCAIQEQMEPR